MIVDLTTNEIFFKTMIDTMMNRLNISPLALAVLGFAAALAFSCTKSSPDAELPAGDGIIKVTASIGTSAIDQAQGTGSAITQTKAPKNPGDALADARFMSMNVVNRAYVNLQTVVASVAADGAVTFVPGLKYDKINNYQTDIVGYWPVETRRETITVTVQDPDTQAESQVPVEYHVWDLDGKTDLIITENPENAGNYLFPMTDIEARLSHAIARLEVICVGDTLVSGEDIVKMWGKIEKIELLDTPKTFKRALSMYDRRNGPGVDLAPDIHTNPVDLPLLQPDYATAFTEIDVPSGSNDVVNAAIMTLSSSFGMAIPQILRITTTTTRNEPTIVSIGVYNGSVNKYKLKFTAQREIKVSGVVLAPWTDLPGYDQDVKP